MAKNRVINFGIFDQVQFPNDVNILREYASLKKTKGAGESACMAYCNHSGDILGSSNLRDIAQYCKEKGIVHRTTMDFLFEAYTSGLMNESECDLFIYNVISQGSILPYTSIHEFKRARNKE